MTRSWLEAARRFFRRRARRILGASFGATALKLAEVAVGGEIPTLLRTSAVALPFGQGEAWEEACASQISETMRRMGMRPEIAVASLPEARLFSVRLALPRLSERELAQAARWEAARRIPLEEARCVWDYTWRANEDGQCSVWLVAAQREDVESMARVFRRASLPLAAVESEALALARLLPQGLALDIARREARLLVFARGLLQERRLFSIGGEAFTEAARDALAVSIEEAEAVKRRMSCLDARVAAGASGVAQRLAQVLAEAGALRETLQLVGGGACLDGLVQALAAQRVQARVFFDGEGGALRVTAEVARRDAAQFAGAAALCLREEAA